MYLLLCIYISEPTHLLHMTHIVVHVSIYMKKGKFRYTWIKPRLEEAFDCIRRLPPPGNTTRQLKITSFMTGKSQSNSASGTKPACPNRTKHTISVIQWNARSLSEAKAQELSLFAASNQIDVLCISELGHRRKIPGYKVVAASSTDTQSAVFTRAEMPAEHINIETVTEFVDSGILTQICLIDTQFLLIHTYIAPRVSISIRKQFWNTIQEVVNQNQEKAILVTGDLNTRSPEISPKHSSDAHGYFSSFLEESDMTILNDGTPTRGENTLDVCIANERFLRRVTNWEVLDEFDSDHLPTLTETGFKASTIPKKGTTLFYKYLDVESTVRRIVHEVNYRHMTSANSNLGDFHKVIVSNLKYNTSNKPGSAIWNKKLTTLKRKRNQARHKLRNASPQNCNQLRTAFISAQEEFRKEYYKCKNEFQQQAVVDISKSKCARKAWKLTKAFIPGTRKRNKRWLNSSTSAVKEAQKIGDKFEKISSDPSIDLDPGKQQELDQKIHACTMKSSKYKPISKREMLSALSSSNSKSANGADDISIRLLTAIIENPVLGKLLQTLFNKVLITGEFPKELKIAKIRALPKQDPEDHRPISLLSNLGKILEKMITTRIREQISSQIHPAQQGCRSAHGTAPAISRLLHHSGVAASKNQQFGFITFDFSKAYDRVNRSLLLEKMINLDIDPYLILVVKDWLEEREFFVHHRGTKSDNFVLQNGIPQGSALSVLLWLIYVNDIPIHESDCNIYVDDVIVWASGPTRELVLQKLNQLANQVFLWSNVNRVKINFKKTHLLLNNHQRRSTILIGSNYLKNKQKVRYLGVDFLASPSEDNSSLEIGRAHV